MTLVEKLRFLADRIEDEKEFYIGYWLFKYQNEVLMEPCDSTKTDSSFMKSVLLIDSVIKYDLKLKPQWEFTEYEKVILRSLPDDLQWIARNSENDLYIFGSEPLKDDCLWVRDIVRGNAVECLSMYNHRFQSIQWSDDEPCEFRKYL